MADSTIEINPDDSGSLQSDINLLDDISDTKVVDDKETKTEESTEDDPSKEDEVKLSDEDEEEVIEDEEVVEEPEEDSKLRPSIKTMTQKHPELLKIFKEFPALRDAYFREGKLSQFFPSVEDAEVASGKADALDNFSDLLKAGQTKEIFEAIATEEPKALGRLAKNILPTLMKINSDLFYEATTPVINTLIRNLHASGVKEKNNNKAAAAQILAHFLYNSYDIPPVETVEKDPEVTKERQELDKEKRQLAQDTYNTFDSKVEARADKLMTKLILDGLDPNDSLSEFTKSGIIKEVINRVGVELEKNPQYDAQLKKLWRAAQSERYSDKSAERILSAFLSRAKLLIPSIRSKVKNEALGIKTKGKEGISSTTKKESGAGSGRSNSGSDGNNGSPSKPDRKFWRTHTDKELLG